MAAAHSSRSVPRLLSIAGSDSGGGAGIQADLKAFAACGAHGMTAITAITAQNTVGVQTVHTVPAETIVAQVRSVVSDIRVDAVKVGMLGSVETVRAVAAALDVLPPRTPIVVDPVMVAESGATLLDVDARDALVELIVARASVITPNLPEARVLVGVAGGVHDAASARVDAPDATRDEREQTREADELARALLALGPQAVVVTGGHRTRAVDVFLQSGEQQAIEIAGERHADGAAHGSGCTHSSLLAAQLALGATPLDAARVARALAGEAVRDGLRDVGAGPGPVDVLGIARLRGRSGAA
jgi:hydroxymethylpyrimidine/phosphomethylpyrimidine kinase